MLTIFIATSSFGVHSKTPLGLLEDNGIKILFNNTGGKLDSEDLIRLAI